MNDPPSEEEGPIESWSSAESAPRVGVRSAVEPASYSGKRSSSTWSIAARDTLAGSSGKSSAIALGTLAGWTTPTWIDQITRE